ncbi:hypothetical protein M9434_006492 [Picochlorum sp. BPE23]|nr:hypothetical protein M9434_006492 [Picochlorum sp. BPE23]
MAGEVANPPNRSVENIRRHVILNFERFLQSCEEIAAGDAKGKDSLVDWKNSPVFHSYVESLEDRLAELQGRLSSPQEYEAYQARIMRLSDALEPLEGPSEIASILERSKLSHNTPFGLDHGTNNPLIPRGSQFNRSDQEGEPSSSHDGHSEVKKVAFKPISVSEATKTRLHRQSELQDSLADELADMASALKESTKAVEAKVQERNAVIDSTESHLEKSVQGTKSSVAGVEKARKSSRMNLCFTLFVFLAMGLGFAGMYIFIRVTSFTGYKSSRAHAPQRAPKTEL